MSNGAGESNIIRLHQEFRAEADVQLRYALELAVEIDALIEDTRQTRLNVIIALKTGDTAEAQRLCREADISLSALLESIRGDD